MILEVRPMTWKEQCRHESERRRLVEEYGDDAVKVGQGIVEFVLKMMYPDVVERLTPAEMIAVFSRVMELSSLVREEEIKNLKA